MIPIEWGIPLSILFVILDLTIAATRVSLLNLRPLRLLSLREEASDGVDRTLALIEDARLRPTLRFSQTATRILLAGVILSMAGQVAAGVPIRTRHHAGDNLCSGVVPDGRGVHRRRQHPERAGTLEFAPGNVCPDLDFVMSPLVFLPVLLAQVAVAGPGGGANDRR